MTVLADFQTIIGDRAQRVERPEDVQIGESFVADLGGPFEAGGRITGDSEVGVGAAFLLLTVTELGQRAEVFVNGNGVGTIEPSQNEWRTQVIAMAGSRLVSGTNNQITVRTVDPFWIKDLICFYHQDSD